MPSVSIDIEISGHGCFPERQLPNSVTVISSFLKHKQIQCFCYCGK